MSIEAKLGSTILGTLALCFLSGYFVSNAAWQDLFMIWKYLTVLLVGIGFGFAFGRRS